MKDQALGNTTVSTLGPQTRYVRREGRGTWVLTVYAISGLALFGTLAYYFSAFVTQ